MLSCSLIQSKKIRHISEISHIEILIKELIEVRFVECTVNWGFLNGKIPILRQNIIFFIKLTKVLEVVNFRFLANFRFLTLYRYYYHRNFVRSCGLDFYFDAVCLRSKCTKMILMWSEMIHSDANLIWAKGHGEKTNPEIKKSL